MASKYSLIEYDAEDERDEHPNGTPPRNLFAAALFMQNLLSANGVRCAFMGGFSMACRGSSRTTLDIDVATDATMKQLWAIVEPQPRLIIPDTKLIEGVLRVFVKTGSSHGDVGCTEEMAIETDLAVPGARGAPLSLENHRVALDVVIGEQTVQFHVIDLFTVIRTKLQRLIERDVYDICFILNKYSADIQQFRSQLDPEDVERFLYSLHSKSAEEQTRYRDILRKPS